MKKHAVMFVGCATLLSLASAAQSAVMGPYASISGGMATLNDADMKFSEGTIEFDTDPGIALTAALGYDFGANFRMETELAYQQNDLDQVNIKGTGLSAKASGEIKSQSGLLNGYYDFTNISSLTPFVSVGLGLTKVELGDVAIDGEYIPGEVDGTAMAYQVGGGFSYALNYNLALDLKYRYFAAVDLELDDNGESAEFDYSSHNVYGGIRASF
ncbi:porin family protein [Desulfobulbus sp. F1]|nr:porin family protein [Desulfobulbus sp. F1]